MKRKGVMSGFWSPKLCVRCLEVDSPRWKSKGSGWLELGLWLSVLLWLPLAVLALLYTLWRLTNYTKVCRSCGSIGLVPLDSERARQIRPQVVPEVTVGRIEARVGAAVSERSQMLGMVAVCVVAVVLALSLSRC